MHNIAFSIEKVVLSELGETFAQIEHCLQAKPVQKQFYTNMLVDFDVRGQQGMDFFSLEEFIMDSYFVQK